MPPHPWPARARPAVRGRLRALRGRGGEERGVVLILVALLLTAILASAALALDLGHFYQAQTQAQSAADAAALAAAQDLAGPSSTAAAGDGTTIAQTNYPGATVSVSEPTASEAKVVVSVDSPSIFGAALGLGRARISASAVAAVASQSTKCTNPGRSCYAIFAMDTSCSSNPIDVNGGGVNVNGGIWSNGSIEINGGNSSFGPTFYGSTCSITVNGGGTSFSAGPTPSTPQTTWPVDYSDDFAACGGAGELACTGPCDVAATPCPTANLTPSFCTQASNATSWYLTSSYPYTLQSGNIYCAVGTGQPHDPSTWTGAIVLQGGGDSAEATYVAGSLTTDGGGDTLTACGYSASGYEASGCGPSVPVPVTGDYPLAYLIGSGQPLTLNGGKVDLTGDVFAPNGSLTWNGGGDTLVGFIEAQDATLNGGGITGDGPTPGAAGSSSGVTVALLQ